MANYKLSVYFIHADNIDFNNLIYLPLLRSNILSRHRLIFSQSEENREKYYKELMSEAHLYVVDLTYPTITLNMEIKEALLSKKPILALADKNKGYDEKYQKLFNKVLGYTDSNEFCSLVEQFVKDYLDNKSDDSSTIVLGNIN